MAYNGEMFPLDFQPLVMYQSIKEINDLKYFGNYFIYNYGTVINKEGKEEDFSNIEENFGNLYFATGLYYIVIHFLEDNNFVIRDSYIPGKIVGMILETVMENCIQNKVRNMNVIERIDLIVKLFYSLICKEKIVKNESNFIKTLPSLIKETMCVLYKFEKDKKEPSLRMISSLTEIDNFLKQKLEFKNGLKNIIKNCCESLLSIKLFLSEISILDNKFKFDEEREMICKVFFFNFVNCKDHFKFVSGNENSFILTLNKDLYDIIYKNKKLSKKKCLNIISDFEKEIDIMHSFYIITFPFFRECVYYIKNKYYLE